MYKAIDVANYVILTERKLGNLINNLNLQKPYIQEDDQTLINSILKEIRNYNTSALTNITINQSPWKDTYIKNKNNIISRKKIKNYFSISKK